MAYKADDIKITNKVFTDAKPWDHTLDSDCSSFALQAIGGSVSLVDQESSATWTLVADRAEEFSTHSLRGRTLRFVGTAGRSLEIRELVGCLGR